jgi:hypothetical protein
VSSTETLRWSDREDEVLGGDLTAALAYVTPAAGVVLAAVAPIGLRDREHATVSFTTSLGFGRKLDRIRLNPNVALAYHAREHGFATATDYVLVQGRASFDTEPDAEMLEQVLGPASTRFMGPPRRGRFWDRWLREYYSDRVLVTVQATRVVGFDDLAARGEPRVCGQAVAGAPAPQTPPAKGTGPRVDVDRAARRARRLPHVLLGFVGADGLPMVLPVTVEGSGPDGLALRAPDGLLPRGGRRAGLLAHRYEPKLIGLESRQHTGWLQVADDGSAVYAPHTESGFRAPANKTVLLLANGLMAKRGLARARRGAGRAEGSGEGSRG